MKKITTHCLESQNLSVPFYSAKHLSLHGLEAHSFTNRITPIWKEVPLWGSTFPWHTPKYNQDIQYSHTKSSKQSSRYYHQSRNLQVSPTAGFLFAFLFGKHYQEKPERRGDCLIQENDPNRKKNNQLQWPAQLQVNTEELKNMMLHSADAFRISAWLCATWTRTWQLSTHISDFSQSERQPKGEQKTWPVNV